MFVHQFVILFNRGEVILSGGAMKGGGSMKGGSV